MLEYTSRQVIQLSRQYEMFLKSLEIMSSSNDKSKICAQMDRIEEKLLEETNSIYEEEYNKIINRETSLVNEEKDKLLSLIKLIEDRSEYVKNMKNKHKEITGNVISYPSILGENKLGEFKKNIKIIDKFAENKKRENFLTKLITELDYKISEAVKKIKNNKSLNTTLEKKMINLLNRVFDKQKLYKLNEEKETLEEEFKELEYSVQKAKENIKKAKTGNNEEYIIECDSLLSSVTIEYEEVKEKIYTIKLMSIYDSAVSDYEQLLNKREEINNILTELSNSYLYNIIGDELNKQYNTIKIEKQDMNTYEALVKERETRYNELENILEENESPEFKDVLDNLLENEKKHQEELLQEQRKQEYEERQRRLIEEKKLEDERRKRQQLILEERKKEQEARTKELLEQQRKTFILPKDDTPKVDYNSMVSNTKKEEKGVSFNSVLAKDEIPVIKNDNLKTEKIDNPFIEKKKEEKELDFDSIFPTIGNLE